MAADPFAAKTVDLDSTSAEYDAITPNDGADLAKVTRGLIIQTGGAVKVTRPDGVAVTLSLPAGQLSLRIARLWATGTTATGFTGLW